MICYIFLAKQVGSIEADLKQKSSAYNALKVSLQSMEKKQTGSLLTRNLGDLVKKVRYGLVLKLFLIHCIWWNKLNILVSFEFEFCYFQEHFVLDSEYLTTLLVCVPLATMNDWHSKYEQLTDMVVPRYGF